ncbi:hypothetical protein [Blastochloris viridis]|uniref:Uncharacterized protein n=1 Tax=Blastochloris viridis TaxID=1079 RepID=A0A182D5X8_BLAVI|nr:hypothetical protein [Blastochloris viridis]BAS00193.1 hypothetical protein BV133_2599 [Blastochloris viridis]
MIALGGTTSRPIEPEFRRSVAKKFPSDQEFFGEAVSTDHAVITRKPHEVVSRHPMA